jgi:hypothetical protein
VKGEGAWLRLKSNIGRGHKADVPKEGEEATLRHAPNADDMTGKGMTNLDADAIQSLSSPP